MRVIAGWRGPDKPAASTDTMSRFETGVLTRPENLEGLARLKARWVQKGMARTAHRRVILDMGSSESPVHGEQEGAAYNGHFGCVCYQPIFIFNQFGDCEETKLRPGNVHSAHEWRDVLESIMARYEQVGVRRTSGPMQPLPARRCMSTWRITAASTPSGSPATRCWSGRSNTS